MVRSLAHRATGLGWIALGVLAVHFGGTPAAAASIAGIDVYSGNGTINWSSVKSAGNAFAFVKATEGVQFLDSKFQTNIANANNAGLWTAPYHFAHPESKNGVLFTSYNGGALSHTSAVQTNRDAFDDATSEASDFLTAIRPSYLDATKTLLMKPVLDLELKTIPDFGDTNLEKTFVSNWVQVFSDAIVASLGVRPLMYLSAYSAKTYWTPAVAAEHEFWIAQYKGNGTASPPVTSDTPLFKPWSFWQWSDGSDSIARSQAIPGISGDVDRDIFSGTSAQLAALHLTLAPEPSALLLICSGGLVAIRRRQRTL